MNQSQNNHSMGSLNRNNFLDIFPHPFFHNQNVLGQLYSIQLDLTCHPVRVILYESNDLGAVLRAFIFCYERALQVCTLNIVPFHE